MLPKTCQKNICFGYAFNFMSWTDVFRVNLFQIPNACYVTVNLPSGSQYIWQRKVSQGKEGEEIQIVSPEQGAESPVDFGN